MKTRSGEKNPVPASRRFPFWETSACFHLKSTFFGLLVTVPPPAVTKGMSTINQLTLIDRLDNKLSETETNHVDASIAADRAVAAEWNLLKLAVETIGLGAIRDKVSAAVTAAKTEAPVLKMEKKEPAVVRSMFRTSMRIAVAAVLILGASVTYKVMTVDNVSIYNKSFQGYELSTFRGNVESDKMDMAYRSSDWSAVLNAFNKLNARTNKSYFLAGVAELQLKDYPSAVSYFEQVLAANKKNGSTYYQAECEYFVALAYLINNQSAKGVEMLRKIKKDVNHPYYPLASKISTTELQILAFKK